MTSYLTIFDADTEARIETEILADAYNEYETAMGWVTYLQGLMTFPFQATCINVVSYSPLKEGDTVTAVGFNTKLCQQDMFVSIQWNDRIFDVPLYQLEGINVDDNTRQGLTDWQYWVNCGRSF